MICDVGYWEAAAYIFAAFVIGGVIAVGVMAVLMAGRE
jgi:hypothetical protein